MLSETDRCIHIKASVAETLAVVNVGHLLSRMNRRQYDENRTYRIRVKLEDNFTRINAYALAPTWRVYSALRLAHEAHYNNTIDEINSLGKNEKPKWRCFRSLPPVAGAGSMYPVTFSEAVGNVTASLYTLGEFAISKVITSGGLEKSLTLSNDQTGGNLNIFREYDQHRSKAISSPAGYLVADTIGYDELQDDVDLALLDNVATEGNDPPYDISMPIGEQLTKTATLYDIDGKRVSRWFDVPTGWLVLNSPQVGEALNQTGICIEIASGDYNGVKADQITKFVFSKKHNKFLGVRA